MGRVYALGMAKDGSYRDRFGDPAKTDEDDGSVGVDLE